jgi:hypothetical protein
VPLEKQESISFQSFPWFVVGIALLNRWSSVYGCGSLSLFVSILYGLPFASLRVLLTTFGSSNVSVVVLVLIALWSFL